MAGRNAAHRKADSATAAISVLDEFIGYNLKRAYMTVQADYRRAIGEDGLGPRVFSALALVVQQPQITQSGLARMLGIERSGLVAIADELEKKGYVTRATVPGDRRVHALIPTPTGIAAFEAALDILRAHEARLLGHLSASEKDTLIALLQKIRSVED